jgi:hypothetical protein
LQLLKQITG